MTNAQMVFWRSVDGVGGEYFALDEKYIVKLDPSVSFCEAAMIEPLAVAESFGMKTLNIRSQDCREKTDRSIKVM